MTAGPIFFPPPFVDRMKPTRSRTSDGGERKKGIRQLELNEHGLNGTLVGKVFQPYSKVYL